MPGVLVIGYGNPRRGDDGLGPALAAALAEMNLPGVTVEIDHQLTVDHAALIAAHDVVVFADAAMDHPQAWRLSALESLPSATRGSHCISPCAALHLSELLYGKSPSAWVLAIAGTEFGEVKEGLGKAAQAHLDAAPGSLKDWLAQITNGTPSALPERLNGATLP